MPLETASFFPDLNSANPAHTDPQAQGDAHIRLIKATVKATFPNFTSAALTSTQAAIDAAVAAVTGGTVSVGAGSAGTPSLNVNGQGGLYSPGAHQVGIETNGISAIVVNSDQSVNFAAPIVAASSIAAAGTISAAGAYSGGTGQLVPSGSVVMWLESTAPAGWLFLNGQAVSRTTFATLFTKYGTGYGAGNGTTTFNLPNMQEVAPVGQSTMGGASSPGRMTHTANIANIGAVVGEEQHALVAAENAPHIHGVFLNDPGHLHDIPGGLQNNSSGQVTREGFTTDQHGNTAAAVTNITVRDTTGGGGTANQTASQGSGTAHNNVQTSFVLAFIVKT